MNTSAVDNGLFSVTFSTWYNYATRMQADSEKCWICIKREWRISWREQPLTLSAKEGLNVEVVRVNGIH